MKLVERWRIGKNSETRLSRLDREQDNLIVDWLEQGVSPSTVLQMQKSLRTRIDEARLELGSLADLKTVGRK